MRTPLPRSAYSTSGQLILSALATLLLLAVAACNDGQHGIDVHGRVIDSFGEPLVRARVSIGERSFVTNTQGQFTFEHVTLPYDLSVVPDQSPSASFYVNLSSSAPTLREVDSWSTTSSVAYLKLNGPVAESETTGIVEVIELRGADNSSITGGPPAPGERWASVAWSALGEVTLHAYVFQYEKDPVTHEPIRYLSYDEFEHSVQKKDTLEWNIDWKPFPFKEATIEVEAMLPEGYHFVRSEVDLHIGSGTSYLGKLVSMSQGRASFVVPVIEGLDCDALVHATSGERVTIARRRNVDLSSALTTITVETGPEAITPESGTQDLGPGAELSWRGAQHPALLMLRPKEQSLGAPALLVYTEEPTFRLPSLTTLGLEWLPNAEYEWYVMTGDAESVDELAAKGWPDGDQFAYSFARSFTIR